MGLSLFLAGISASFPSEEPSESLKALKVSNTVLDPPVPVLWYPPSAALGLLRPNIFTDHHGHKNWAILKELDLEKSQTVWVNKMADPNGLDQTKSKDKTDDKMSKSRNIVSVHIFLVVK